MNIFIAEDEPLAAAKLRLFLQKLGETDTLVFDNGISLLAHLTEETPDVLFLDIQMPGATGIDVMKRMQQLNSNVQIIITSAFEQYAIESFQFSVTDYLLKPYSIERLSQALTKARNNIRLQNLDRQTKAETISIRCEGRNVIIPTAEIISLESLKDYVRITTTDGQKRITLGTLGQFEERLNKNSFVRIHRSFIINLGHLTEFSSQSVIMFGRTEIPIGKTYREQIEKLFKKN